MAKILRWEPFKEIERFRRDMERLFDSFLGGWTPEKYEWYPPLDVEETDSDIIIRSEIPGMKKEDIKIVTKGNLVTISGEKHHESEQKGKYFHRIERNYGKFERTIELPTEVEVEKAKASYENGVLTITFPKPEWTRVKAKEVKIEIK